MVHGRSAEHPFDSFGVPEVARVGVERDRKLAVLLETLGVDVPMSLQESLSGRGERALAEAGCKSGCNLSKTRRYPDTQEWL